MIKVIGHKSPDTDTVCSAIVYAWYLEKSGNSEVSARVCGRLNKETQYVLERFRVKTPGLVGDLKEGDRVAIVDTNNAEELPEGVGNCEIVSIVDHHKLTATLKTDKPILVNIKPLACTCTLLFQMIEDAGFKPDDDILSLILSAILSDTLAFRSPTTTDEDRNAVKEISKKLSIDIDELSEAMFGAKSDLTGVSMDDLVTIDRKLYEMGGKKVSIGVFETTDASKALERLDEIKQSLKKLKESEKLDYVYFFVVDILNSQSTLIVISEDEKRTAEKAFGKRFEDETLLLKDIISRKKQIAPVIEGVI